MKKPLHERIADARLRQAQLAARLAAMESKQKAADRKNATRRKIVVGAAVLIEMERTPRFAAFVREMLDQAVTRPQDREVIVDLLRTPAAAMTPAVNGNAAPPRPTVETATDTSDPVSNTTARDQHVG